MDVVGNAAKIVPEHIGATGVKVGVLFGVTVIVNVVVTAHCPAVGVKVYVVVVVLFRAGDHTPVIPLLEVVGSGVRVAPEQMGATGVKVGVITGFTVMVSVGTVAHCPAVGVKV